MHAAGHIPELLQVLMILVVQTQFLNFTTQLKEAEGADPAVQNFLVFSSIPCCFSFLYLARDLLFFITFKSDRKCSKLQCT